MPGINPEPHYTAPQARQLSEPTTPRRFLYRGTSMHPIFRPGDCLSVTPVALDRVRIGDVIVYCVPNLEGEDAQVVHRVIALRPNGLGTQGDSNPCPDPGLVKAANLIGVVASYERNDKVGKVLGGKWGWLNWRLNLWVKRLAGLVVGIGRYPYRWLRRSELTRRIWQPKLTRVRVETVHGPLVKYIHRRRTVAHHWLKSDRFEVSKPYDLVIPSPCKGGEKAPRR
jgi:signal peptidase I